MEYAARAEALSAAAAQQKCETVAALIAKSDTELLLAMKKGETGHCAIAAFRSQNEQHYKVTLSGEDYPLPGVSYSTVEEVSKTLREALDGGSCL